MVHGVCVDLIDSIIINQSITYNNRRSSRLCVDQRLVHGHSVHAESVECDRLTAIVDGRRRFGRRSQRGESLKFERNDCQKKFKIKQTVLHSTVVNAEGFRRWRMSIMACVDEST